MNSEVIKNCVLVCIVNTHLVLLKEKWHLWNFRDDKGNIIDIQDYKKKDKQIKPVPEESIDHNSKENLTDTKATEQQNEMEKACLVISNRLFKVVTLLKMDNIVRLDVHKGKDPSVELTI